MQRNLAAMTVTDIKHMAEREPFRPFAVRLSNGTEYRFETPRDFGAPRNYKMIFYFGKTKAVRIDTESIVEIIEDNS